MIPSLCCPLVLKAPRSGGVGTRGVSSGQVGRTEGTPNSCMAENARSLGKRMKCDELQAKLKCVCEHVGPENLHHLL